MTTIDKRDQKVVDDIKKYGLHVVHVFAGAKDSAFSYSIGLFETYKHPEVIIIGLKQELSHILINNMAEDIKNGKVFKPLNFYPGILDDFECYIVDVNHDIHNNYIYQAEYYYDSKDFPLIQVIYPTVKGVYPWEKEWPESIKDLQPILGPININ